MRAWFSRNRDRIWTVVVLFLTLFATVLNLLQFVRKKGWETHNPPYLYPIFLLLLLALILFFLIQAIVKIVREEKREASRETKEETDK